jgi:NAD+ synthase (glutamine-hydrolysing)
MKVLISQINPTPGDFEGNFEQICDALVQRKDADLIVFPENAIGGYLAKDMLYNDSFIESNLIYLHELVELSKDQNYFIVVGYVDRNTKGFGKPFKNMAAVIHNGTIVGKYQKRLLPFYDVFDEGRYFEPGSELCVVKIKGVKWGICICEDLWNDKGQDDYNYQNNPIQQYNEIGITNIIAINSSPFVVKKTAKRIEILQEISRANQGMIIYVNQVGGMDELVFDGNSCVIKKGHNHFFSPFGKTSNDLVDLSENPGFWYDNQTSLDQIRKILVLGLRDYIQKSGFKKVVVSSSGGIDSAVVLALACEAIGPENVYAIRQPSIYSSEGSKSDAELLHTNLGCHDYIFPIDFNPLLENLKNTLTMKDGKYNPVADENIQARLRAITLMHFSNAWGCLALTTGNKTESATGYSTLGGDMMGGFAPIQDLYKLEVYDLARNYNQKKEIIPNNIIEKPPSAELAPGQSDEESLLPYNVLDEIVKEYIENHVIDPKKFKEVSAEDYYRIIKMIDRNEFKRRQAAPGIKVHKTAFGSGRRLPIVKK